jgi:beta-galactosidase
MLRMSRRSCHLLLVCVILLAGLTSSAPAAEYTWIEAESLAKPPAGFKVAGWGNKHYLSGEAWLFAAIENEEAKKLPECLVLSYPFTTRSAGEHEVWARVGYEFVRTPFRWRVDDEDWGKNGPDDLTTDLMDIAEWTEIAWVKLGKIDLDASKHTLQIAFDKRTLPGKPYPERLLTGLDSFCISKGPFRPNGPHKPDADWKQAIDREAAKHVFHVAAGDSPRSTLPLGGAWEIARWDEQVIKDRDQPVKELPADYRDFHWKGVRVPGNRDSARPDMLYCHRFLYRTRIDVPAALAGESFVLRFPSTALLASVFVNGKYCTGNSTPTAAWDADITNLVKPGEVNEIVVAIKDCYYALARVEEGGKDLTARRLFNFPVNWFYTVGGLNATRFADFPVLFQVHGAGIFETPTLTVAGPVHVSDVFAKPSVKDHELTLEITLHNPTGAAKTVRVANDIVPVTGGASAKTFIDAKDVTVPAGGDKVLELTETWDKPHLWWPDDPYQYHVVTRIESGGKAIDVVKTKFGFRQWEWKGKQLSLNGVPWHFRADLLHNGKLQDKNRVQLVADWKKAGINTVRYWGYEPWVGDSQEETLDFYDRVGMPVRRTGIFDGEGAPYLLVETKDGKTVARKAIFDNWRKQLAAWVKAERNHPSVFVWSIENEITYINIRNFGWLDACEPEIKKAIELVMKLDPTRPAMIDGGDALRDRSLPIYGNHYNETNFREYPDEAYTMKAAFSRHKGNNWTPWPIGDDKPLFLGESFFAMGFPPAAYSAIQGGPAFLGRSSAEPGVRLFARMLAEGYRWHGIAGFHFWMSGDGPDNEHYKAFQPVCVLCREWNSTFVSGQNVKRTLKVFNDTHDASPIRLDWLFCTHGLVRYGGGKDMEIPPGETREMAIEFRAEAEKSRTPAELVLICSRNGKKVFEDEKQYAILDSVGAPKPNLEAADLLVLDPAGAVRTRLKRRGIAFTEVASFDAIPAKVRVLVVGPNALTPRQATDPKWQALAAADGHILVLDQDNPLHYQALPADLVPTPHSGRIAFPENAEHPAFAGLGAPDFFCWSGDHVVYRRAYKKATRGARSLLQCDDELSCTALSECPVGPGLLMLAQLDFGAKLASDPVAGRLFDNLLNYTASYKPVAKTTVTVFPDGDLRLKLLDASGLRSSRTNDILEALRNPKAEVLVADASPANLAALAGATDIVKAFTTRGGQLMLWGLTPEGLADFNKVVGVNHVLRPFKMERVTMPAVRDPLLAGLTNRDVALESSEQIYPWSGDRYPANNTFTHVVDLDDIAPFIQSKEYAHGFSQMTNGLTSADSWKFIFYHDLSKADPKPKWSGELPREEEVTDFSIIINAHYHRITKLRLIFDDDRAGAVTLDLKPVAELRQDFPLKPRRCKRITLEPLEWTPSPSQPVIGVDNIWIKVRRGDDYTKKVVPLLNIGALVRYRMGAGGITLNQVRVQASEPNPVNTEKKQNLVATLLRNLGATFAAERLLVAGVNLKYTPVPLAEKCTQFLTAEKGWLDGGLDLAHLPIGEQKFAGVSYLIRDFKTSPLPSCIMLAGPGVKGAMPREVADIPVGHRADVLFFLHTFHKARDWQPSGDNKTPPVLFRYVVHYADGKSLDIPIVYDRGVGPWIAEKPAGYAEAAVAWAAPFPKDATRQAVVYQMQWTNPRPAVAIKSIDMRYDDRTKGEYGVPVLLAITAANPAE